MDELKDAGEQMGQQQEQAEASRKDKDPNAGWGEPDEDDDSTEASDSEPETESDSDSDSPTAAAATKAANAGTAAPDESEKETDTESTDTDSSDSTTSESSTDSSDTPDKLPVRDRPNKKYIRFPPGLHGEFSIAVDTVNITYKREAGEGLDKTRYLYPIVAHVGVENAAELSFERIQELKEEIDEQDATLQ